MTGNYDDTPLSPEEKQVLKKKIHRALVEARKAMYNGDEETVREIIQNIISEAAPAAYKASKEGAFNWVVEELKPLDELLLPDDEEPI
jgi:hypothetical protein